MSIILAQAGHRAIRLTRMSPGTVHSTRSLIRHYVINSPPVGFSLFQERATRYVRPLNMLIDHS
jgi:hypothetical protein